MTEPKISPRNNLKRSLEKSQGQVIIQNEPKPPPIKRNMDLDEKLKSRLISQAPIISTNFNSMTLGLKRITKTQHIAIKRRQPVRLEPLPTLSAFQDQNQPSYIQSQNRCKLLEDGWEPAAQRQETSISQKYVNIATRQRLSKTESLMFVDKDPLTKIMASREQMISEAALLKANGSKHSKRKKNKKGEKNVSYNLEALKKANVETILQANVRNPLHVAEIVQAKYFRKLPLRQHYVIFDKPRHVCKGILKLCNDCSDSD